MSSWEVLCNANKNEVFRLCNEACIELAKQDFRSQFQNSRLLF